MHVRIRELLPDGLHAGAFFTWCVGAIVLVFALRRRFLWRFARGCFRSRRRRERYVPAFFTSRLRATPFRTRTWMNENEFLALAVIIPPGSDGAIFVSSQ